MCGPAARLVPSLAQCTSDHLTSLCPRDTHGSPPLHPLATQADSTSSADRHLASSLQGRPIYNSLKSAVKSNPYESTCCSVQGAGWEMRTGCLLPFMLSVSYPSRIYDISIIYLSIWIYYKMLNLLQCPSVIQGLG